MNVGKYNLQKHTKRQGAHSRLSKSIFKSEKLKMRRIELHKLTFPSLHICIFATLFYCGDQKVDFWG